MRPGGCAPAGPRPSGRDGRLLGAPACFSGTSGAYDYVESSDFGQTGQKLQPRDRSIIFEVCLDAATPATTTTWGRVKAFYR